MQNGATKRLSPPRIFISGSAAHFHPKQAAKMCLISFRSKTQRKYIKESCRCLPLVFIRLMIRSSLSWSLPIPIFSLRSHLLQPCPAAKRFLKIPAVSMEENLTSSSQTAHFLSAAATGHRAYRSICERTPHTKEKMNRSPKETPASACQEIENGAVDCCPLPENESALAKAEQLPLTAYSQDVLGITFNTQYELFCHKTIRNALLSSLQRLALIDLLPKEHLSLSSLSEMCDTSDNTGCLFDILSKIAVPYDAHAADTLKKTMDQLGAQTFPKLTILCDDDPDTQQVVNALIERWNTLTDRYINKEPLPRDELKKRIRSGDYFAAIAPVPINSNDPLSFLETFSSDSAYNPADLSDPVFDERLHRLHTTARSDLSEMRNTLRYLLEEGIFYPLYAENNYFVCAKNVSGIVFHAQDGFVDFSAARKTSD